MGPYGAFLALDIKSGTVAGVSAGGLLAAVIFFLLGPLATSWTIRRFMASSGTPLPWRKLTLLAIGCAAYPLIASHIHPGILSLVLFICAISAHYGCQVHLALQMLSTDSPRSVQAPAPKSGLGPCTATTRNEN